MAEAVKWWKKAAEQGQPSAQYNLAQALQDGKEVSQDLIEAYKWYSLAAEGGDRDAAALRNELAVKLSPAEVGEALKRARDFKTAFLARNKESAEP